MIARSDGRPVTTLGALAAAIGIVALLGMAGSKPLAVFGAGWREWWGLLALPVAAALAVAGLYLALRAAEDPWRLPWARVLGAELATVALLGLAALAAAPGGLAAVESSPAVLSTGGRIGWAMAHLASAALGSQTAATLFWLVVLAVGAVLALAVGADEWRAWLAYATGAAPASAPPPPAQGAYPTTTEWAARRPPASTAAATSRSAPVSDERAATPPYPPRPQPAASTAAPPSSAPAIDEGAAAASYSPRPTSPAPAARPAQASPSPAPRPLPARSPSSRPAPATPRPASPKPAAVRPPLSRTSPPAGSSATPPSAPSTARPATSQPPAPGPTRTSPTRTSPTRTSPTRPAAPSATTPPAAALSPEEALYREARALARSYQNSVSAALLQRKLRLAYPQAKYLYDRLVADGLVIDLPAEDEANFDDASRWEGDRDL